MSRLASVFATFVLCAAMTSFAANITVPDCITPMLADNKTASLNYFEGNFTVGTDDVDIIPCDSVMTTFDKCGDKLGYLATYVGTGAQRQCQYVYNIRYDTVYDEAARQFSTPYDSTFSSEFSAAPALTVVVKCVPLLDVKEGTRSGNVITFSSETVCPGYNPNATAAPTPAPEEGLSTGAIVGIVIGALAILVIVLVIFRWKAQKGEEEGEYQRV